MTQQEKNKALVLEAFDTAFNKGTKLLMNDFGHPTIYNTAPILSRAGKD